jgi:hypothetical protein
MAVVFACFLVMAPASAHAAASTAHAAVPSTAPNGADEITSSTLVASGPPVPQRTATRGPAPRIGPFRVTAEVGVRAAKWLLLVGGVQVVALMIVTRRARSRLSARDVEP